MKYANLKHRTVQTIHAGVIMPSCVVLHVFLLVLPVLVVLAALTGVTYILSENIHSLAWTIPNLFCFSTVVIIGAVVIEAVRQKFVAMPAAIKKLWIHLNTINPKPVEKKPDENNVV